MKISDAANILSLSGDITTELVKTAYRRASAKYHPDRNPAGLDTVFEGWGRDAKGAWYFEHRGIYIDGVLVDINDIDRAVEDTGKQA